MARAPHFALIGASGSGKTTLALQLAWHAPRAVIFDRKQDPLFDHYPGPVVTSRERAQRIIFEHRHRDYQMVVRLDRGEDYLPILGLIYDLQRSDPSLPPVAVVMEEATAYSGTHDLPDLLEEVVTQGRAAGVVVVTVIQEDSQVHPTIRRQANKVIFHHTEPTALLKDLMAARDRRDVLELETLDPLAEPVQGTHFVAHPSGLDVVAHFYELVRRRPPTSLPDGYRPPLEPK